jgi:hypothetical protein
MSVALAAPPPLPKILKSRMDQDFTVDDVLEDVGLQILGSERIANFMDRWGCRLVRLGRRPRRGQTRGG